MSRFSSILIILVSAGLLGCSAREERVDAGDREAVTTSRLEPYECGTISRLHTFDGVFLASQPAAEDFEHARDGGVRTVINLRHESEFAEFDERSVVEGLGLSYVNLPWKGPEELSDTVFDRTRALLETAERPILLHCSSANRVGAVWIPWRVLDGGLDIEAAVAEAKVVGLRSPDYERLAREYVASH